jgi:uncharacterized delta-60 repeat protein
MKIRLGCLILLFSLVLFPVSALASTWAKTYGGSSSDEARSIQQTSDGGFIVAGHTSSFGTGDFDYWVLKLNASGNVSWQKTYGGSSWDEARSIQQTSDGGFIVAGYTESFGGGDYDYWVLKLNASGNVSWQKTYGGPSDDFAYSIQQTSDGGFIVAGEHWGYASDFCVLKLDANGNVTWQKTYGTGYSLSSAYSIQQTSDGGFIIAGTTHTGTGDWDYWVLKLNASGNVIWEKTYGGSYLDKAYSIQQTSDGGFIVAGGSRAYGFSEEYYWVLKLNASGNVSWQKTYGPSSSVGARSIQQTLDGGFIIAGGKSGFSWVLKLNASGNVTWQKTYGPSSPEGARSIQQTSDGGFIVVGYNGSFGAGNSDFWVLKLDANGNIPGCNLIQNTSVVPGSTTIHPSTIGIVPQIKTATVTNTAVVPINTAASVKEQCFYAGSTPDLVYAPVTPCRIVDTRLAGGAIPPGGIRSYNVWGDVAPQGGDANCPSPKGEPYTAHINVTAVPVSGNGNIVAYPFGSTAPNASLVNYRADAQNIANSATVKTCNNCTKDISIKSNNGTAHVIIDVLGYDFAKP